MGKREPRGPNSIWNRFHRIAGWKEGYECSGCRHVVVIRNPRSEHYKCELIGLNGGKASDIRLTDMACMLYSPGERKK